MGNRVKVIHSQAMLNLFQSNQMTALAGAFCDRNDTVSADPFVPMTVIVQSFGLGQWLKLQLAEHHGIAANIDCKLPATFLWQLYQCLMPELKHLRESPYERHRLIWRIMRLLRSNPGLSGAVKSYLDAPGDADLRLYQLASELTLLLDEYLMYRPDWVHQWTSGAGEALGHEQWQRDLWNLVQTDLRDSNYLHRAELHQRAISCLAGDVELPWQRLSIFGLSTMPPLQLETFRAISHLCEVDIYFLNPCEHYWGDIVSPKDLARRSIRGLIATDETITDEDYLEIGNPLLSSLGKQGREMLEMLLETPEFQSHELFTPSDTDTALGFVKNDVLALTFGGEFGFGEMPPERPQPDDSLQVHICHSRMREVEVLKDQLLRQIRKDPSIRLSDILVMVPDISEYAPYVHSVFSRELTYRLADTSTIDQSTVLTTFLTLMKLPESRFSGPQVMDLLEVPAIMRKLELLPEDLETISYWINGAGIRWELDGASKAEFWSLPTEEQNSWRFGLDRLLLGFALDEQEDAWQNILPFNIEPSETFLLGRLCDFIDLLASYREKLNVSHTATEWLSLITDLTADFFAPDGNENLDVSQLLEVTEGLVGRAESSGYDQPLSRQLVIHAIEKTLTGTDQRAGFISGGITFATLVPMRSIPFRVICLLGMNDGEYPRDIRPHSFDLIAGSPHRKGDRSKKLDDRYLFLESLLSAEDLFYVSYVGRGIRDDKERPPSVVVQEWLDYLNAVFDQPHIIQHALQPYNVRYFKGDHLQSFNEQWFRALSADRDPTDVAFLGRPLPADETTQLVSISQLGNFYSHPARYFLQRRLGVYLDTESLELADTESFELDHLERFQLADAALRHLVDGNDPIDFQERILRSGRVLPGEVGRQHLEREMQRARNVMEEVSPYLTGERRQLNLDIKVAADRLKFSPPNLYGDHLVHYRAGKLRARQRMEGWVSHLAMNIAEPGTRSVFIFRGDKDEAATEHLAPMERDVAEALLTRLADGYHTGIVTPPFAPAEACYDYTTTLMKYGDPNRALQKTRGNWERDQPGAEGGDRYWQRLFRTPEAFDDRFAESAVDLWQPILERISHE